MRWTIALFLTFIPAFGQIADIATDFTGSNLLFWTRFRLQSETDSSNQQKVYRWRDGEWSRVTVFTPGCCLVPFSSSLSNPFVSGNGGIYGWTEHLHGRGVPMFRFALTKETAIGITLPSDFPTEYFNISSNGRYVAGGTYDIQFHWHAEVLDTQTGIRTPWAIDPLPAIADDGTLAYKMIGERSQGLRILAPGKRPQLLRFSGAAGDFAISPNAQWAAVTLGNQIRVYSTSTGDFVDIEPGIHLPVRVYPTSTGNFVDIAPGITLASGPAWKISNTRVLFLSPDFKQLLSLDPATRTTTVVMESASDLFADLALSGDGNVGWAVTETNQLWRLDLLAGSVKEILPPLPSGSSSTAQADSPIGEVVRGSSMQLQSKYSKDQTVAVDGQPWPISSIDDNGLWFQIPWEYHSGPSTLTVRTPGNPFESVFPIAQASDFTPYFVTRVDPDTTQITAVAAHADFSGVVSVAQPARPGEIVHVYMTGLGPLVRDVPTGTPGPVDGVKTTHPLTCYSTLSGNPASTPLTLLNATYEPNVIGIYQVDLAVPANAPAGFVVLHCGDSTIDRVGWLPTRP